MSSQESEIIDSKKRNHNRIEWYGMSLETIQEFVPSGDVVLPNNYKTLLISPKPVRLLLVDVKLLEKMADG
jgi:hypothetical protein